ncbi:MAG: Dabb family protein [Pyrinomonadaceae bacterium]
MSIVHMVMWKYRAETDAVIREDHISKLRALPSLFSDILEFEVGADVLKLDRSFDTGLYSRFADLAALEAYTIHPEHQKVAAFGREIAEKVISVDFESPS